MFAPHGALGSAVPLAGVSRPFPKTSKTFPKNKKKRWISKNPEGLVPSLPPLSPASGTDLSTEIPKGSKMPVLASFFCAFLPIKNQAKINLLQSPSKISKVSPKSAQGELLAPFWAPFWLPFWSLFRTFS